MTPPLNATEVAVLRRMPPAMQDDLLRAIMAKSEPERAELAEAAHFLATERERRDRPGAPPYRSPAPYFRTPANDRPKDRD